jgi:hypothetical protein
VEGPAARGPQKSLNAGAANGRHQAKSQSEPTLSVQGAPQFCHPMVRLRGRGDGSRLFVALAVDWFKCDGENGKLGDVSKLTKWAAALGEGSPPPFSTARLRPSLSNYRRPATP